VVVFEHVSKWFGDVVAVSDVTFGLQPGITALLGPNGAGKSTVLRMLCGLARPSTGQVRVLGGDPRQDLELLGRIGLVGQQEALFDGLTPMRFVEAAARLLRVASPADAAERALHEVELDPRDPKTIGALSKGNRQRVKVAAALGHDPDLLVLDEPLNGLDPRQRVHLIDVVRRFGARPGRVVVVSSHVLDEVERFAPRILVIAKGRLAAEGDIRAVRDLMDDRPHRLRLGTTHPGRLAGALLEEGVVLSARVTGDGLEVETTDVRRFRRSVAVLARDRQLDLSEVVPLDDDLESVFRYLVDRP
jgi:ABC-2 type transport system ATP-binding protein